MQRKGKTATSPGGDEREEDVSAPTIATRTRRGAVSAETYSEEDAASYERTVCMVDFSGR